MFNTAMVFDSSTNSVAVLILALLAVVFERKTAEIGKSVQLSIDKCVFTYSV